LRASRRRRVLAGAAAAVPAALTVATAQPVAASPPVTASPPAEPDGQAQPFCSTELLSAGQVAAGATSTITCYPTLDESLRSIGVDPSPYAGAGNSPEAFAAAAATDPVTDPVGTSDNLLALHYDDVLGRGTVLSIGGSGCDGGGISLNAGDYWNDRIRSTMPQACSKVKHWADANYTGSSEMASSPLNLSGLLAGRVTSIRYYS
jgi:hypothetical protein